MFEERAVYSKQVSKETYEDRGFKHLYGKHHECMGKDCLFCNSVIGKSGESSCHSVNYKENDSFQLENEEMSCDNVHVDYANLKR